MANWFAQNSSVANINASDIWYSNASGSGGSYLTWPPVANDVLVANGKDINVNIGFTCAKITTKGSDYGGSDGGSFLVNTNVELNPGEDAIGLDIEAGSSTCLHITYGTTVSGTLGNITGGDSNGISNGGIISSIVGDITGGSAYAAYGIENANTISSIVGNITGGYASYSHGIANVYATISSIVGNITGGFDWDVLGIYNEGGTISSIVGNITGGSYSGSSGISNTDGGIISTIDGIITGMNSSPGIFNTSTISYIARDITGGQFDSISNSGTISSIVGNIIKGYYLTAYTDAIVGTQNYKLTGGNNQYVEFINGDDEIVKFYPETKVQEALDGSGRASMGWGF